MPDCFLTFDAIVAMDDEDLNLAIEKHVYGRHWTRYGEGQDALGDYLYEGTGESGSLRYTLSADLAYTRYWDKTMELRQEHGQYIDCVWVGARQTVRTSYGNLPPLTCTTSAEVRRAICQVVLWQKSAQQAWVAEEATWQARWAAEENRLMNGEIPHTRF